MFITKSIYRLLQEKKGSSSVSNEKSSRARVEACIRDALDDFNEMGLSLSRLDMRPGESFLYQGALDSMSLVHFIVIVEDKLEEEYGIRVDLSNDAAFSKKNSPFLNMRTFLEFACERVELECREKR